MRTLKRQASARLKASAVHQAVWTSGRLTISTITAR
jgi:hypothetical protein